jgi:uncharacterized membrane protein YfcA
MTQAAALVAAFVLAAVATPAGISGAVLLLPFQVSVLGTPSPAVTPTNLLYNVVATPGALYRYWRQGQTGGRLAVLLIAGTLPGVIAGSVIRVELLPGSHVFDLVVAAVLLPLSCWLALSRPAGRQDPARPYRQIPVPALVAMAALASTFVTSVAGVITFTILSLHAHAPVAPDWPTGLGLITAQNGLEPEMITVLHSRAWGRRRRCMCGPVAGRPSSG